jgi:DNA uptake protein ComE-like DNA-binding protein
VNIDTRTLTDLESIPGIGPKSLENLRPFVKVYGETEKLR